jgi:hypothetical protein
VFRVEFILLHNVFGSVEIIAPKVIFGIFTLNKAMLILRTFNSFKLPHYPGQNVFFYIPNDWEDKIPFHVDFSVSSTKVFHSFLQFLRANARIVPKLCYNYFLPHLFEFVIHLSDYHTTLHSLSN